MKPVILWNNIFTAAQVSADSQDANFPDDNLANLRPYRRWKSLVSTNQFITFNVGGSKAADAIAMSGHNLGTIGASVTVQYWTGGAWATVGGLGTTLISSDKTLMLPFTSQAATQWRISLTGMTGIPEIGVIMLGARLTMERYLSSGFDPDAQTTHLEAAISQSGNMLGASVRYRERQLSAKFEHLTPSFVATYCVTMWEQHVGLGKPFFFAWDLGNYPTAVYLVNVMDPSLRAPYDPVRRSLQLDMRAVAE